MCLSPIRIPSNSRIISREYLSKGYFTVPCNQCAECQQQNSLKWQFRAYWQFKEVVSKGGFALFDTLTYAPEHLPTIDKLLNIKTDNDFPCFSLPDVQAFLNRLRSLLRHKYHYKSTDVLPLKYFLTSEYGTSEHGTHRPHYHVIFYVLDPKIKPLDLSYMISSAWTYGRTDGVKWKGKNYLLQKRVIFAHTKQSDSVHMAQYVAKYVEKDCDFSVQIRKRLYTYLYSIYGQKIGSRFAKGSSWIYDVDGIPVNFAADEKRDIGFIQWLGTYEGHKLYLQTKHLVEQFHKQSQQFGAFLIPNLDMAYLFKTGCQKYTLQNGITINVPLPQYYKCKVFQQKIYICEKFSWSWTDLGKKYLRVRKFYNIRRIAQNIDNEYMTAGKVCPANALYLAHYLVNYKDCVGIGNEVVNLEDVLKYRHDYQYIDKRKYHGRFVSSLWQDDDKLVDCVTQSDYLNRRMIRDDFALWSRGFDAILDEYDRLRANRKASLQALFENKQKTKKKIKVVQTSLHLY